MPKEWMRPEDIEWYNSRPKVIQKMIDKVPYCFLYRLKRLGNDFYIIRSYSEGGSITATRYDAFTKTAIHDVFGLKPKDFVKIDESKEKKLYKGMRK